MPSRRLLALALCAAAQTSGPTAEDQQRSDVLYSKTFPERYASFTEPTPIVRTRADCQRVC